ncbi:uncharacterized protein LOC142333996 [Lycorma delicatula]|uniref:uncharacterized protein LOC142333996 n=1 Tax=Lycorma delicatula TaxID=130591 RepID=UPI003F5108DB
MEDEGQGWGSHSAGGVRFHLQPWSTWCSSMTSQHIRIVAVAVLLASITSAQGMCPARCYCRDDTLQASCADAGLEVVPIQLNPDLQEIDLHGNRIINVDYTLRIYQNLRHLDISINKIGYLGKHNFELQDKLLVLNISRNQVVALKKGVFKGLKSLRTLDLSHNELQEVEHSAFHETVQLEELDLSHNKITSFYDDTVFKTLRMLRVLSLTGNEILEVPSAVFKHLPNPSLEVVELSNNLIGVLEERSFPALVFKNLQILKLAANVINDVHGSSFNSLHALSHLDLSYNNLSNVPTQQLAKLSRLTELNLSGNAFNVIPPVAFQSLFQLKVLRLSWMPYLHRIESRAFVDNIHLETVVMNDNLYVTRFPSRIFFGNPHLLHISLRRNSLTTLDESHFPLDRLRTLDVSGNPFNCNCSLLWLWKLAEQESSLGDSPIISTNETSQTNQEETVPLRLTVDDLRCDMPEALHGTLLINVPESTVRCDTTWTTVAVVTAFVLALFAAFCIVLLLIGTERSFWTCGRDKEQSHSNTAETHRLATGPPVLMLMPDKQGYMEPWVPVPVNNEYMTTSRKSPHIVYV